MPSPRKKAARVRLTVAQQKQLLIESHGACGWCKCQANSYDFHHIDEDPSHTVLENLIPLCGTCHDNVRYGKPSPADLRTRKLELKWLHTSEAYHASGTSATKTLTFIASANSGPVQQAERITNHYRTPKRPRMMPAPDSIAAHAAERSYIEYLRDQYIRCRLLEQKYGDGRKFVPSQARNSIKRALGYAPLEAPIASFEPTWRKLHAIVCGTLGARKFQNGFCPHDWAEHQRRMGAGQ